MEAVGYISEFIDKEDLNNKINELVKNGVKKSNIYREKKSKIKGSWPQLDKIINDLNQGDLLVVTQLTQIAASLKGIIEIAERLDEKGIRLKSLKEELDATTKTGEDMFSMLMVLSKFRKEIISQNTKIGMKALKKEGKHSGRPKMSNDKIDLAIMLYDMGKLKMSAISTMSGVKKSTIYNYLKKRKEEDIENKKKS
jgi:DNA invertase Pin-like site-specific DNA recombinase